MIDTHTEKLGSGGLSAPDGDTPTVTQKLSAFTI